jgi:hypothetical protein
MRTLLVVFCALLMMNFSLEAKKKMPASQKTQISKQHRKAVKQLAKSRKAPKVHQQRVN